MEYRLKETIMGTKKETAKKSETQWIANPDHSATRKFCYKFRGGETEIFANSVIEAKTRARELCLAKDLNYAKDSLDFYEIR